MSLQSSSTNEVDIEPWDIHKKWSPMLNVLSVTSNAADETPVSLMIVAHVTYRSSVLARCLDMWRHRLAALLDQQRWMQCLAEEWYTRRRLFLFFRAWQWRYRERVLTFINAERAEKHCNNLGLKKSFRAWRQLVKRQRDFSEKAQNMYRQNALVMLLHRWTLWRRLARLKLSFCRVRLYYTQCIISHRLNQWRRWTIELGLTKIRTHALQVHIPVVLSMLALQRRNSYFALAARYYMIQWIRVTSQRRGLRLQRYAEAVRCIVLHRKMQVIAHTYRRWILRTASTLQCRRILHSMRSAFFFKWMRHHDREYMCTVFLRNTFLHIKQRAMSLWTQRVAVRALRRQCCTTADAFWHRVVRTRQCAECFRQWTSRAAARRAFRTLQQSAHERHTELLRDVCVSRMLQGVLLSFLRPAERSVAPGGEPPVALGPLGPLGSSPDCVPSPESVGEKGDSAAGPLAMRHHLLVSRARPIPLGGSAVPLVCSEAPKQTTRISVSTQHDTYETSTQHDMHEISVIEAAHELSHPRSISEASSHISHANVIAQGRSLLTEYRALRAAASAEEDEARIVREQLRLCERRREISRPPLSEIEGTEAQLRDRLLVLRQRKLQRQAMRAQVMQFARQLEETVRPNTLR